MPDHTRRTAGRPRRPDGHLREHTLRVSVSPSELASIRDRARSRGLRAGPYLRRAALLGSGETDALLVALSRALLELRGLAANANQHSHRANIVLAAAGPAGLDVHALAAEQASMAALAGEIARASAAVRAAIAGITGSAQS